VLCKVQNAFLQGFSIAEWQQLKDLLRACSRTAGAAGPTGENE
jgi:hypothetical protein